jgi:general secretion pathway protein G
MEKATQMRNAVLAGLSVIGVCLVLFIWWQRGIETLPKVDVLQADLKAVESALMMYRLNCRDFPTEEQGLSALVDRPDSLDPDARWVQVLDKVCSDPWGDPYVYERVANGRASEVRVYSRHSDLSNPEEVLVMPCGAGKETN